jgi:hypothetical protein
MAAVSMDALMAAALWKQRDGRGGEDNGPRYHNHPNGRTASVLDATLAVFHGLPGRRGAGRPLTNKPIALQQRADGSSQS